MTLWRINLKPDARTGIEAAAFCIQNGVVGIGWGLEIPPASKEEYLKAAEVAYKKEYPGWQRAANAILSKMQENDLVWTRNPKGKYFLGRITGEWQHRSTPEYQAADIANIRPCIWCEVGASDNVPGKVVSSFGPSATVQPVWDKSSEVYSMYVFNQLSGTSFFEVVPTSVDLLNLLSAQDLEDVVGVYLQVEQECVLYPSSCKNDTQFVEYLLWSVRQNVRIGVQVKSGHLSLRPQDYSAFDGIVYLFAASGQYTGASAPNTICLEPSLIRNFIVKRKGILPGRIRRWLEFAEDVGRKKPDASN